MTAVPRRLPSHRRLMQPAVTVAALVAAALVPSVVHASPASAAATQQFFTYTGGVQKFTVPTAVTQIFVSAIGASGGEGGSSTGHTGGPGGAGAGVSAALPVTPGEVLTVYIGHVGADASAGGAGANSSGLTFNGKSIFGGSGGGGAGGGLARAGSGGGATVVEAGSTPLLVAGGGGGGGGANPIGGGGNGGSGGDPVGNGSTGYGTGGGPGGRGAAPGVGISGQGGQSAFDLNGAGGGGGSGWVVTGQFATGGGGGGVSEDTTVFGTGGGGGGGAGASSVMASATNVHVATALQRGSGTVFLTWDQPATTTTLSSPVESLPGQAGTFRATVAPATPATGDPLPTGTVSFFDGSALLATAPVAAVGGSAVASYPATSLSPGLHAISAAYNGDGVYAGSTSITRTDQVDALAAITSPASLAAVVGVPVTFVVRTTGVPAATITATGSLDGLTFADNFNGTATLSGRPAAAGSYAIKVAADNGLGSVAMQTLTITVTLNPLTVGTASLPQAYVGQAYSTTLVAAGGTPPYSWSVTSGSLPPGLTLSASGTIAGTPRTAATSFVTIKVTDSTGTTHLTASRALALVANGIVPAVYVANGGNNSVTSYPLVGGNVAPATRLAGTAQGLNAPSGLVLDVTGRLYVSDSGADSITEYDRGAAGPTVTIAGPHTGLATPAGLTLDGAGRLYVADRAANTITVYAAGARGDAAAIATISGPHTGLSGPAAVTVDGSGRLWVANSGRNSLTAYPAGATGDVTPSVTIAGSATGLNYPQGLSQDSAGNLLVANTFGESITAYSPTASGNAFPLRTIAGTSTGLSFPTAVDIDTTGAIYVANQFDNDITRYGAAANGNVAPTAVIAGGNTGLAAPNGLAVSPPLAVLTSRLPVAQAGRRYAAVLRAGEGTTPYRWRIARGNLPAGLHLHPDGTIDGKPVRRGTTAVTVRVTDSSHPVSTATARLVLSVRR
jgi:6-phosphogluconolactonase (cycloisomerase 2 family)